MMKRFILASGSPRRRALLHLFGLPFEVVVADVDEELVTDPNPAGNVIATARLKAEAVATSLSHSPALILAADTTVALDGQMLNKPAGPKDARRMLQQLRGRRHQVHTGIILLETDTGRVVTDVASVEVPMRQYSNAEIEAYIATGDPLDKAGAYAIQHPTFKPVANLADCYAAVVGLPLCHVARALRRLDVNTPQEIAPACQRYHAYQCPVYANILAQTPPISRWHP